MNYQKRMFSPNKNKALLFLGLHEALQCLLFHDELVLPVGELLLLVGEAGDLLAEPELVLLDLVQGFEDAAQAALVSLQRLLLGGQLRLSRHLIITTFLIVKVFAFWLLYFKYPSERLRRK